MPYTQEMLDSVLTSILGEQSFESLGTVGAIGEACIVMFQISEVQTTRACILRDALTDLRAKGALNYSPAADMVTDRGVE